jgi:enoyl-CoA hydratase
MATIAFNRPDKLNTLSIRLRQDLDTTVQALAADPAVRVLILTGTGRAFTAGLDLDEWAAPAGWPPRPTCTTRWRRCSAFAAR